MRKLRLKEQLGDLSSPTELMMGGLAHQVWDTLSQLVGSTQVILKSITSFSGSLHSRQLHLTTHRALRTDVGDPPKPAAKGNVTWSP